MGDTVAPDDEDVTGGSGSDVDGAGFGENTSCNDSCEDNRDEDGTASFEGSCLGANTVYLSHPRRSTSVRARSMDEENPQ